VAGWTAEGPELNWGRSSRRPAASPVLNRFTCAGPFYSKNQILTRLNGTAADRYADRIEKGSRGHRRLRAPATIEVTRTMLLCQWRRRHGELEAGALAAGARADLAWSRCHRHLGRERYLCPYRPSKRAATPGSKLAPDTTHARNACIPVRDINKRGCVRWPIQRNQMETTEWQTNPRSS